MSIRIETKCPKCKAKANPSTRFKESKVTADNEWKCPSCGLTFLAGWFPILKVKP